MGESMSKMNGIVNQAVNHAIEESGFKNILKSLLNEQTDEIVKRLNEQNEGKNNETLEANILELKMKIEALKVQVADKDSKIKNMSDQVENLSSISQEKDKKISALKEERDASCVTTTLCLKEKKEITEKYELMMSHMKPCIQLLDAYDYFLNISSETKSLLKNIYTSITFNAFISASMQWDNIEGIWNFIRRKVIEEEEKDLESLHKMFLIIFDIYVSQNIEPTYKLIIPAIGSRYDSDKQVILGTKTDGSVEKVLLEGIENCKTKKLIGKAIIFV